MPTNSKLIEAVRTLVDAVITEHCTILEGDDALFHEEFAVKSALAVLREIEAMLCYKQLWTVEQTFRTAKHLFTTRPIFHKLDETIRGHVFCSFLALVLKRDPLKPRMLSSSCTNTPGRPVNTSATW